MIDWDHVWRGWEVWEMALFDFALAILAVELVLALAWGFIHD